METLDSTAVTAEICRRNNISPRTLYTWRARFPKACSEELDRNPRSQNSEMKKMLQENDDKNDCNHSRIHLALGYVPPVEFSERSKKGNTSSKM